MGLGGRIPNKSPDGIWRRSDVGHGRSGGSIESAEGPAVEYEYILEVGTLRDLTQLMVREKIPVPRDFALVSFKAQKLLDMKEYQKEGLISSYVIIKTEKKEEVVDESLLGERTRSGTGDGLDSQQGYVGVG